jgi:preprotein translocase subunit SecY
MRKALEPLILSWRVPELRNRLIFVLVAMVAYVFTIHIPVPNVDPDRMRELFSSDAAGILGFLDIFGGGALSRLSILALGYYAVYHLQHRVPDLDDCVPAFKELQKEGEYGRRKIAKWTRWATIGLTAVQASVAARAFMSFGVIPNTGAQFLETVLSLTAGTMFLIWLGEQITEKGRRQRHLVYHLCGHRQPVAASDVADRSQRAVVSSAGAAHRVCRYSLGHHLRNLRVNAAFR